MMTITIYDSNKEEINEDDVIIVRYPNEKTIYLGLLKFLYPQCDLVLSDGDADWIAFPPVLAVSIVKVCHISEWPELDKWLGKSEFRNKKGLERFNQQMIERKF